MTQYTNSLENTKEKIEKWIKNYCVKKSIKKIIINDDLTVDIVGDINFRSRNIYTIPFQFNEVSGFFDCSRNSLESLQGCPKKVGGYFCCDENNLVNLEFSPIGVLGNYYCRDNQLISLKGCPKTMNKHFSCSQNEIVSLEHGPENVHGVFECSFNKLTSLKGMPHQVTEEFFCIGNDIVNLQDVDIEKHYFLEFHHSGRLDIEELKDLYVDNQVTLSYEKFKTALLKTRLEQNLLCKNSSVRNKI